MRIEILRETLHSRLLQHNPAISQFSQTLNSEECFATGTTLLGHLLKNHTLYLHSSLMNTFIFTNTPISSISEEDADYQIMLHPNCVSNLPVSKWQSFEDRINHWKSSNIVRDEYISDYQHIQQIEEEMIRVNHLCQEMEQFLHQIECLFKEYSVLESFWSNPQEPGLLVEWVKTQIMARYHLLAFPACFECKESTKKSRWWKRCVNELVLNMQSIIDIVPQWNECQQQVRQMIYSMSRTKLCYPTVMEYYTQLKSLCMRFENGCKAVEIQMGLSVYQFANKLNANKKYRHYSFVCDFFL